MKCPELFACATLALLVAGACNRKSPEDARRVAELEAKASQAEARQQELEQQLADQKLAAEREAMERERMQIEEARAALEQLQGEAATAAADQLRQREEALATREGQFERLQATFNEEQGVIDRRTGQLSERERDLAGREALDVPDEGEPQPVVGDYGTFYDSLAPYGSWFETPDYGYVWQPVVVCESSWRPYTRGRWACSDHGWTWISDEPHGWATYHYGRWCHLHDHGWVWVPGTEWAPSWVAWRLGNQYVGWAPLPPESLAYRGHHWDGKVDETLGIGPQWYNFVELRHMGARIGPHCLPGEQNGIFYQKTASVTNIYQNNHRIVSGGPGYREISAGAGHALPFYRLDLDLHARPGLDALAMRPRPDGDRLRIAAPNLDAAWNAAMQPPRVKGRMETPAADRPVTLRPEITERFRQSREENRAAAEQAIGQLGGREPFNLHRLEQLDANRRLADESARQTANPREAPRQGARNPGSDRQPAQPGLTNEPARNVQNPAARLQQQANEQRDLALRQQQQLEARNRQDQEIRLKAQLETRNQHDQALKQQQSEAAKQNDQARLLKLQQDAQAEQARQHQLQQEENNRREQAARQAEESRRQAEHQAEQARQHQLQQEENNRREQAARQAEESRRQAERQTEESRKQADDEAKKGHGR